MTLPVTLWFIILYLIVAYAYKGIMTVIAYPSYTKQPPLEGITLEPNIMPPLSILVPVYNQESTIVATLIAKLHLNYPQAELIVINDGSTDNTLQAMIHHFMLAPFPERGATIIPTCRVRAIYRSSTYPALRVIDKERGSLGDALNAGINACHTPLYIHLSDKMVLHEEGLINIAHPFLSDSTVVACSGTLRRTSERLIRDGQLFNTHPPRRWVDQFALINSFRPPWAGPSMGAISIFKKSAVEKRGGYRFDGSDSELRARLRASHPTLHLAVRTLDEPFFLVQAEPLAPSRLLDHSLFSSMGKRGWGTLFSVLTFEWLFPLVETIGVLMILIAIIKGLAELPLLVIYLGFCVALRSAQAVLDLLLDALVLRMYTPLAILQLLIFAIFQNLGVRQYQDWKQFFLMLKWATSWSEKSTS